MSDRRQSGLWNRNPQTGTFEQQVPIPHANIRGPYNYYEPPPRNNYQPPPRQSYPNREADPEPNEPLFPSANNISVSHSKKQRGSDAVNAVKDLGSQIVQPIQQVLDQHPETTSDQLAQTKHVNEVEMPSSKEGQAQQPSLKIDPEYVPDNLRAKAWSPDIISPKMQAVQQQQQQQPQPIPQRNPSRTYSQHKSRQTSNASHVTDTLRRGSVPDRSPLQSLESWSKEEKRARVEEAERKARQKSLADRSEREILPSDTVRSDGPRVVSEGAARRPSQRDGRRQASGPASPGAVSPSDRSPNASEALRREQSRREKTVSSRNPENPRAAEGASRSLDQDENFRQAKPREDREFDVVAIQHASRPSTELGRSKSNKYRARDAGFVGAAAAYNAGPVISTENGAAERGKAAYERRKISLKGPVADSPVSPSSQASNSAGLGIGTSGSKRSSKRSPLSDDIAANGTVQNDRLDENAARKSVDTRRAPNTASHQQAEAQQVLSRDQAVTSPNPDKEKHHHFSNLFHHNGDPHRTYQPSSKPLDDWRNAKVARLTLQDFDLEQPAPVRPKNDSAGSAWWEKDKRKSSGSSRTLPNLPPLDGPYEEKATEFRPRLWLKCGPLLRYTGLCKEAASGQNAQQGDHSTKDIWRGSIMIVTEDEESDLSSTPRLRLFAQPMDLHRLPPHHLLQSGRGLPADHEDPVAGQVKLSRTGRPLYARPVVDIDGGDLSREETADGLFASTRTPVLGPQSITGPDGRKSQHITFQDKSRVKKRDGEQLGRYREVKAIRLHTERGYTFWRFSIEVELGSREKRIAYRINQGPALGFWVPARGETMNIMFHSCNGFSHGVDPENFSGPDPLWRDVLNRHQSRPFHVMIGGGDQIYNDAVGRETKAFAEWMNTKNIEHKYGADFSAEMQDELEQFYLDRYAMWFSQGLFAMANSQIPMVNIWDDHDIIDGYGSYPHHMMATRVFTGLGAVAFKYYMLFQHQSLIAETEKEEPSWLLGPSPGPYIHERSRSMFLSLGNKVAFLGVDCRTERMRDEVLSQATYEAIFARCRAEIIAGQTKHLIVLLGVPIAYPRLNFLENILTSRVMDPIKAIGRTGILGGFVNKFDGGAELLDDLNDHWTAKEHKIERNEFIEDLQDLAADKSVRITILGGDVHLGAVGQFYSSKKLGIPKDRDHRYMPNVISSAIVNTPPPPTMADVLNRRNKVHHLNDETDEDMIPMFSHDIDGSKRNNMRLLPRRNFCIIREYVPGSTPPGTPVQDRIEPATPASVTFADGHRVDDGPKERRFPPSSMKRTLSLTRGSANLVRRFSNSSKNRNPPLSLPPEHIRPYNAEEKQQSSEVRRTNSVSGSKPEGSYFPPVENSPRPINTFHRRPTDLSIKEARKAAAAVADGTADGREPGHVDLEGGLDISLCMEVNQHDSAGVTVPYRLLVPALWYKNTGVENPTKFKSHRESLMRRLKWNRKRETPVEGDDYGDEDYDYSGTEGTITPSPPPMNPARDRFTKKNTAVNAMGLTNTGRGALKPYSLNGTGESTTGMKDATPRDHASTHAYNKGYSLSSPPVGAYSHTSPDDAGTGAYPKSGYRHSSAPNGPRGAPSVFDSEDSLTASEGDVDSTRMSAPPPERRGSKAERFFGIGDAVLEDEGRRASMQKEERPGGLLGRSESVRRKAADWKVWK